MSHAIQTLHKTVKVGDLDIFYREAGPKDAPAILLLHGFPQTSMSWAGTMSALGEAGHRAVAFDQRGYSPGARPVGVEHYGIDSLVADARRARERRARGGSCCRA